MDNYTLACVVLLLNGFGFACLILICGQLLFANGACMGIVVGVIVVVYMGMEKNSMDDLAYCSTIIASYFTKLKITNKYKRI